MGKKFTFPAEVGAPSGLKYYEVQSKDLKIAGCYTKILFHNENKFQKLTNFPIYEQTVGQKNIHYLKINTDERLAPWLFTDKDGKIIYR